MPKEKPAVKTVRIPADMAPLITRAAKAARVTENTWMVAVLAGATGYKLPKK
jgi:Pyruvate/2-oxoacid:ferredoxin oxidoreductase gamma subunit